MYRYTNKSYTEDEQTRFIVYLMHPYVYYVLIYWVPILLQALLSTLLVSNTQAEKSKINSTNNIH